MNVLRVVHRWLGLVLAAIVLLVAASGGLLLLRDPYYRAAHPVLAQPIGAGEISLRAEVLSAIDARWGPEGIRLVMFPQPGLNAFQVWLADGTEAFVDSRTAVVIDRWSWSSSAPAFLFELHAHLLSEPNGTVVNGFAALLVVFMVLTGVVLWWPARAGAFRLRGAVPRRRTPADLLRSHAALGSIAAAPILLFVLTGAAIVFYEPAARVASALLDARPPEEPDARVPPRDAGVRSWPAILDRLDATFADGRAVFYYPGTPENARLMFRKRLPGEWHPNGRSYVVIDPYSAAVVQAIDARDQGRGTRIMHALYPLHAAKVGGVAMLALAAFAAMALTWLSGTGVWTYVARVLAGARRRSPVTGLLRRQGPAAGKLAGVSSSSPPAPPA